MKGSIPISVAFWISALTLTGCMSRAPSLRMLDERADYQDPRASSQDLRLREAGVEGFRSGPVPVRTRPKVAAIWIHPHEMANHDYFWGGWMSIVVEADQWPLTKPGELKAAPGIVPVAGALPAKKPKLKPLNAKPVLKK